MLVDIFSRRYNEMELAVQDSSDATRLLMQSFRILSEDAYPTFVDGKESKGNALFWQSLHDELSRELGLEHLWQEYLYYTSKWNGNDVPQTYRFKPAERCKKWLFERGGPVDARYLKDGLSLIELGFRKYQSAIDAISNAALNPDFEKLLSTTSGGSRVLKTPNAMISTFNAAVDELNTRFRQARLSLHYHNGFIQFSDDTLVQHQIEEPFWALVSDKKWVNVDLDMKEAIDRRDGGGKDPAFYAARSLESAIKIVSDDRGWTTGNEKGAHNFIENLSSKKNGLIERWEANILKEFFSSVRNPFGHGAGSSEMPSLSAPQTDWSIEFAMTWIKSLLRR